jgi:beta-glucosidase-like glycosyl hydrolase
MACFGVQPRFGRISELPGEDPFHSGTYASHYVNGMQTLDSKVRWKIPSKTTQN